MKFGLILPTNLDQATPDGIREAALLAEELGYESIWTTDHVMMSVATPKPPYHAIFEAVSVMAWVAALTTRVRIGVSVLVLPQRHPVLVAKQLATIDRLSGGRVVLGVGAGWHEQEFRYLNADFHQRGRIQDESIQVLRHLWRTPEEPFRGQFFSFEQQHFAPPPAQAGGPPILVGGLAQRALERAARYGDGWHASRISPEEFETRARTLAQLTGGRRLPLSLRMNVTSTRGRRDDGIRGDRFVMGGDMGQILEDVRRYAAAGCELIAIQPWEGDREAYVEIARTFAEQVMPRI